ncbi:signal recognition particle-docking protein FtsY [Lactobacillus delbrueckii subsp. allosunkii]|uniref:Signal recognition particle receptor FtsY n=1 Tax=Lactobacillus delbrueckii subsp. allosunkii TaxID=1050107 RepID=A0ABD4SB43_9LACO|nr:signal recognition particle-docking protein FtsY [Lactobacillus delbrueckii]MCD5517548.1 signal recognition particle-docking protein FtsY [Lactobacillus delbrueckii subsp. sunkii]MCT3475532.1 signal recognition particle-docking protein FtsY [Lactobacillus delbrueckii subsp. lactis]MCZ0776212.1 signal recognition particle-docking protein FtsY [Lactobacillus delbrueckii subsp. sunkii]MCZ0788034.1 signal recognition particle-docking protein FtsY [Lactobacillus delbrueckii subsp. sunkii]MCZ0793
MGLFDRIKKSLFGQKDEEKPEEVKADQEEAAEENAETENKAVAETTETSEEAVAEKAEEQEETAEEESAEVTEETEESTEATEDVEEETETTETAEETETTETAEEKTEAEEETTEPAEESTEEKTTELYEKGLEKSNKGFGARLNAFLAKFRTVDEDFFDDLEELLIESDVGYETSEELTDQLREEAKLQKAKSRDDLKRVIVQKLVEVYDENANSENEKLAYDPNAKPNVYLFVGVNGAGKTTTVGKLAKRFHDQGKKVLLVAADTFRAGAVEQLVEWGKRTGVPVVTGPDKADPAAVVYDGLERAIAEEADYLLVDTAGRLQNKVNLMNELEKIQRTIKKRLPEQPAETLLVLDGSTGQNALLQAKDFDKTTKLSGLVLTKLDGSSKGGVVLSIRHEMKLPVKLVGLGEKAEDLADFDAANYAVGLFHDLL